MNVHIKSILLISTGILLFSCTEEKKQSIEIVLTNTSETTLTDKPVRIERASLNKLDSLNTFPLVISENDTIPSQLSDTDDDGEWDEVFFVTDFQPNETKTLKLKWSAIQPDYEVKTSVRFGKREMMDEPVQAAIEETLSATDMPKALGFQKYQTDGPTWENDKVAFRHYLDGRNAKDVYGKKTAAITPETVGLDSLKGVVDNYHAMEDWGRDVFPVGNSAGLGGYGLFVNDTIRRLGILVTDTLSNVEKTTFKIIEEGPVKSVLKYSYSNWKAGDNTYQVNETTTIWPGMYAFQNTVELEGLQVSETLAIGLSNINNKNGVEEVKTEKWVALIQHDSLTYNRTWVMGTALILSTEHYEGYTEAPETGQFTQSYLAKFKVKNNYPLTYYAVSGWELSQDPNFKDAAYFKSYVEDLANQLYTEIKIEVKTVSE